MKKYLFLAVLALSLITSCGRSVPSTIATLLAPAVPLEPAVIILAPDVAGDVADASLDEARDVLQARLDSALEKEARVTVQESNLRVELASAVDVSPTIQLAKEPGAIIFFDSLAPFAPGVPLVEDVDAVLTEADVVQAQNEIDEYGFHINITFSPEGQQKLAEYTTDNTGHYLVIAQDGIVVSSPIIQTPILDGEAVIGGNLDDIPLKSLTALLNSGQLPFSLRVVEITRQ